MGFFTKLKQKLGIGGVKLKLNVGGRFEKSSGKIDGSILVTSKSDQQIKQLNLKLVEKKTSGRGDDQRTKEYELGTTAIADALAIKAGEQREVNFSLPFDAIQHANQALAEKGGALGALGKTASFLSGEKFEYEVWVDADVEGVAFGPNDHKQIELV